MGRGRMTVAMIILNILKIIFGPLISRIPLFKKKSPTRVAYEKADQAEQAQAQAEEQVADLEAEKEHKENMEKSDDEFWHGGKF